MSHLKPSLVLPLFVATVLLNQAIFAAELTPESRVSEVTVYRQAALVTREARVTLSPGGHRIVLRGLPCVADPDSVRVSGTGPTGIEIGGVEVQQEFRQPDLTPEYRQIEKEIEDLDREQSVINGRRGAIATLREFLAGLKVTGGQETSRGVLTKGFAVESWQKAFDFFSSRLNTLADEERALDARQQEVSQKVVVARGKLSQMTSQTGISRWSAAVLIDAPRGGEMTLHVSYLATSATWQPLYDARLDPATDKVSLSWLGQVMQTTGEDWKDVAITLATMRPSAGIDLPVLASLNLTRLQGMITSALSFNSEFVDALPILGRNYQDALTLAPGASAVGAPAIHGSRDTDVIGGEEKAKEVSLRMAQALSTRQEVAVKFALPGRYDIPSDGQPHKHLIATRDMNARVEHRAVPSIAPTVFLVTTVTLPGEVPLLAGKVQHFVGGDLVGSSLMAERAAGEEFSLSFGPDDRLKVDRKQLLKKVERRGKDDETAYRFVTSLENHLGRDGVVEVKDRIPVSSEDRVVVSLDQDETTPGSATDPKEPGILTWKIPIPKGEKKEIVLTYRVRAPRNVVLAGMD